MGLQQQGRIDGRERLVDGITAARKDGREREEGMWSKPEGKGLTSKAVKG